MPVDDPTATATWTATLPGGPGNLIAQIPHLDAAFWIALVPALVLGALTLTALTLAIMSNTERKTRWVITTMLSAVATLALTAPLINGSSTRLVASWQAGDPVTVQARLLTVTILGTTEHGRSDSPDSVYGTKTVAFTTTGDDRIQAHTRQDMAPGLRIRLACDPSFKVCVGGPMGQTDAELADDLAAAYGGISGTEAYLDDPQKYSPFALQ